MTENSVELLGHYGGDVTHAMSAWTSTTRDYEKKKERMPELLKMLAKNGHETPFEKSTHNFLVRCDTASHINLLKHRIGVSINGESARYKELRGGTDYIPEDMGREWAKKLEDHAAEGRRLYHECLEDLTYKPYYGRSRAKDAARFFLGYTNQLTLDVSFNFRSFMHFQGLRNDDHAQDEIHEIAQEMLILVKEIEGEPFKYSLKAFKR